MNTNKSKEEKTKTEANQTETNVNIFDDGTMNGYIGKIKPQNSIKFSTEATLDSSNVYDFNITKK